MKILFQYGVLGEISSDSQFSVISPYWKESFSSYPLFFKKYRLSPICRLYRHPTLGKEFIILLETKDSGVVQTTLDKEEELRRILSRFAPKSLSAYQMLFYLGAMEYHLCSIARAYTEVATAFSLTLTKTVANRVFDDKVSFMRKKFLPRWISDIPASKICATMMGADVTEAVFYEMMAYITSARSLLDSLMPLLNLAFGRKIPLPHSLSDFMKKLPERDMPIWLKDFMNENWTWLSKLINYRDCVTHALFPSTSPLPSSMMVIHTEHDIIALQTWLPDNPESKPKNSNKKYRFDEHIEYLSYAHLTYLKMLDFVAYVLKGTFDDIKRLSPA